MTPRPGAAPRIFALLALLAASCSPAPAAVTVDDPYAGVAFPRRAPSWSLPRGPYALVSNNGSDTVTVLDLTTHATVATAPVGIDPVGNNGPHHLAVSAPRGEVFVALAYPAPTNAPGPYAAAHPRPQAPGKVVKLSLPGLSVDAVAPAEPYPGDIVLGDDGSRLVVTHYDLERAIAQAAEGLDARRADLLVYGDAQFRAASPPAPVAVRVCIAPHGVALSRPDGRFAFVACYGEDALAVVDLASPDPAASLTRVPVGPSPGEPASPAYGPYTAALSPDGSRVAVGCVASRELRFFDTALGAMTGEVYAALGAVFFAGYAPGGQAVYVPVQEPDLVARLDLSGPSPVETARRVFARGECQRPHEARLRGDGAELYVVCEGDHVNPGVVLALDPLTLETRASMPVGVYPDRAALVEP